MQIKSWKSIIASEPLDGLSYDEASTNTILYCNIRNTNYENTTIFHRNRYPVIPDNIEKGEIPIQLFPELVIGDKFASLIPFELLEELAKDIDFMASIKKVTKHRNLIDVLNDVENCANPVIALYKM